MDEKPDQIMNQIEAKRDELGRNLSELENKVRRSTDWHTYYERNPMLVLGAALGGGLLLGAVAGGSSRSSGSKRSFSSGDSATKFSNSAPKASSLGSSSAGIGGTSSAAYGPSYDPNAGTQKPSTSSQSLLASLTPSSILGGHMNQVSDAVNQMKGALIAFGISKVKEFLSDAVPGLEQHLGSLGSHGQSERSSGSSSSSPQAGSGTGTGGNDYRSSSRGQTSDEPVGATSGGAANL